MITLQKLAAAAVCLLSGSSFAIAQQSVAGNAVAEQLAQSSLRMVGSLLSVLILVAVCGWALRRWRDRRNVDSESIEIVSGISLGSKDRVVLLKVGDEQVLVGVSPAGMQSLHVMRHSESRPDSISVPPKAVPSAFNLKLGATQ